MPRTEPQANATQGDFPPKVAERVLRRQPLAEAGAPVGVGAGPFAKPADRGVDVEQSAVGIENENGRHEILPVDRGMLAKRGRERKEFVVTLRCWEKATNDGAQ